MFCNCANTIYILSQINLSYCSVTDIGLLSLSSISGLQNMTIVHLAGITPNGLTATLMVCGCLTKVKLHEAFKSMMPPHMIKNVEARGCVFQWIDKPFKVFYCSSGCLLYTALNPCVHQLV
jgi:F-box/leucine-rich repeat protein 2/20